MQRLIIERADFYEVPDSMMIELTLFKEDTALLRADGPVHKNSAFFHSEVVIA
jgi:hypothetical protein